MSSENVASFTVRYENGLVQDWLFPDTPETVAELDNIVKSQATVIVAWWRTEGPADEQPK